MTLHYLDFDYSEDADGAGTFDAMASAAPPQLPALLAEIAAVLAWAHQQFPQALAPAEEGGEWQYDLQGVEESSTPLTTQFDPTEGTLSMLRGAAGPLRTTLSLSISGSAHFCGELREAFGIS
jgi:hypothetical protein